MSGQEERVYELERENALLREALYEEWFAAHLERCSDEWPHPEGAMCHCPPPDILGGGSQ